jgi:uncharacterized protein (TIGR00251 family)
MKWTIRVKLNSKNPRVELINPHELAVSVSAPPVEGKANKQVIELLSAYFKVPKTQVKILKGESSKIKVVEISLD